MQLELQDTERLPVVFLGLLNVQAAASELTGIQMESIDEGKSSVRCENKRLERAFMNTTKWKQTLEGQINQHPSTSLAAIPPPESG